MCGTAIANVMRGYAQDAVHLAEERFDTALDFSEESLEQVETILGKLHSTLPKGPLGRLFGRSPSEDQIWEMAKVWGGYVGEVIRRRWGGEWATETAAHTGTVITLRVMGSDIFPPARVHKRLINGPEDNVWQYYQWLRRDFGRIEQR